MRCLPALLLFIITTLTTAPALSIAPAAQRLPAIAKPEHYRLWFEPNLETDTFAGRATIRVQLAADDVALHYAEIRADLKARGALIGANDLFVAAHARALELTLVTNNTTEFERVRGLTTENWTLPPRRRK